MKIENRLLERREAGCDWLHAVGVIVLVLISFVYDAFPMAAESFITAYIYPMTFALAALYLYRGLGRLQPEYKLMLAYAVWILLTRVLNGDQYLREEMAYVYFQFGCCCVLLPTAFLLDEAARAKTLKTLCAIVVGFYAVFIWLCVVYSILGEPFVNPWEGQVMSAMWKDDKLYRLCVSGLHPNMLAITCYVTWCMALYLALSAKHKLWWIPALIAMLGFYLAIAQTFSRTTMIIMSLSVGMTALMCGMKWIKRGKPWVRFAALALALIVAAAATYGGFTLATKGMSAVSEKIAVKLAADEGESAEAVSGVVYKDSRNLAKDAKTLTQRTQIFASFLPTLARNPKMILIGSLNKDTMTIPNEIIQREMPNMHNAYLQTFLQSGLLGFLLVVAYTILLVVRMVRLFFSQSPRVTLAHKALVVMLTGLLVDSMLECVIISSNERCSKLFFLIGGFVLAYSKELCPMKRDRAEAQTPEEARKLDAQA